jgi:hypothetical protein
MTSLVASCALRPGRYAYCCGARSAYRVGGGVAPAVRPHHRAYGTVHGGSSRPLPGPKLTKKAQETPFGE